MRVSSPRGMRLGQSQSGGWGMKREKESSPASCAPAEVNNSDSPARPHFARASRILLRGQRVQWKE